MPPKLTDPPPQGVSPMSWLLVKEPLMRKLLREYCEGEDCNVGECRSKQEISAFLAGMKEMQRAMEEQALSKRRKRNP
jgi:hypothetical protein